MGPVLLGGAAVASLGYNILTNIRKNQPKEQPQVTHGRANSEVSNSRDNSRAAMSRMLRA